MTAPFKLSDAMHLGSRLADLDRADLEALLFSAVTRLAFVHGTESCAELDRLVSDRREFEKRMRGAS